MVPYVSTKLAVRWIDERDAAILADVAYFRESSVPFYRYTETVAAWFNAKVTAAFVRIDGGDTGLRDALVSSGALVTFLRLSNWADDTYGSVAITAAGDGTLPETVSPPSRDVPAADPLVWSGAFDGPRKREPEPVPIAAVAVSVVVSCKPIAEEWGQAKVRKTSVKSPGKRKVKAVVVGPGASANSRVSLPWREADGWSRTG